MSRDELNRLAEKLELAAGDVLGILDDLQTAFDRLSKRQKAGDLGKNYQAKIEAVERAKDALDEAAEELQS